MPAASSASDLGERLPQGVPVHVFHGLQDETVYLEKAELTQPNPKTPDVADDGWLWKVTTLSSKVKSPWNPTSLFFASMAELLTAAMKLVID